MDTPAADIEVDADLADRLVRRQHPDLAGPLTLIANGWDNAIFRLGADLVVRLPRRQVAAELVANEHRWLPMLEAAVTERVDVTVPSPVRVGLPSEDFPWPWTIAPWIDGHTAADIAPADRAPIAADLAAFLAALHRPAPPDAPRNPVRGVALPVRDAVVRERLADAAIPRAHELTELWGELVGTAPWAGSPLWLHGDPHPANLVLSTGAGSRRLLAVLDFGDLTSGDPATDLAAAWLVFDADARAIFRSHVDRLTGTDSDTWARARGWALVMGTAIAAHSDDDPRLAGVGRHVLDQVLVAEPA